ncbi:MAG TPA: UDP-N-acetylmuramate dehydrogenase [Candidatus Sulfotelmatobacter sp.]|nr:UDP-N-acetylmuramate dehydrogenase [Candidatus Sulfotelmatobacter sp.]
MRNEPLNKYTSFRIGGPADYFCAPANLPQLKEALLFARAKRLPVALLGAGTNLLVLDKGFRGLVIKLAGSLTGIRARGRTVYAGGGAPLGRVISQATGHGLGGLEFLAGIPGTVGGAAVMNAGAWGKEIGRYIVRVKVLDADGQESTLTKKQLRFGYRRSILQKGGYIVIEVALRLRPGKRSAGWKKLKEYLDRRRTSQPLGMPNAGSIFKNPPGKFAGRLLEEAGCKGLRIGDAQVSTKHANFIVNLGEAQARDVIKLMTKMQRRVKIRLEPELKIMVKSF